MERIAMVPGMNADERTFGGMTEDLINQSLLAARERIRRAEQVRAEAERSIAAAREEERLLVRLLALRKGADASGREEMRASDNAPAEQGGAARNEAESKQPAVAAVVEELSAAGRPLHISELMRLLHVREVSIPGLGTQANLITHLRRDPRLVRPSRGMYGLATWGIENMPQPHRKRRRQRVRYTSKSRGEKK